MLVCLDKKPSKARGFTWMNSMLFALQVCQSIVYGIQNGLGAVLQAQLF
jgi:hypothetical protein